MRTFIAVEFSNEIRQALSAYMDKLKKSGVTGNFTRPENLHATLAFIGETTKLPAIKEAVKSVNFEPFTISLSKPGTFRDILWIGINGEENLAVLSEKLRRELTGRGIGFDNKPFKAHITLARRAEIDVLPQLAIPGCEMTVKNISVMKSERINGRLTYTKVG